MCEQRRDPGDNLKTPDRFTLRNGPDGVCGAKEGGDATRLPALSRPSRKCSAALAGGKKPLWAPPTRGDASPLWRDQRFSTDCQCLRYLVPGALFCYTHFRAD